MNDQQRAAMQHYEAALKAAFPDGATGDVFNHWNEARKALAQPEPEWVYHPITGKKIGETIDSGNEALAQPQGVRQYYYQIGDCKAKFATDPDCICWHDEGSGPLVGMMEYAKEWREKPLKAQPQGEWIDLTDDELDELQNREFSQNDWMWFYTRAVIAKFKENNTTPPSVEAEKGEGTAKESDGCPTEKAVLQRFWRGQPIPAEHYPEWYTSVEAMRIETLEKAAKMCEEEMRWLDNGGGELCAAAIRSMK